MSSVLPPQYSGFLTRPANELGNLSPLQIAAAYYMDQGEQIPFFINNDWLRALNVFCNSGIVTPRSLGIESAATENEAYLSIIIIDDGVYLQRKAPDCGPEEIDRYDQIYIGQRQNLLPDSWTAAGPVVRGGSSANGVGGPWATGGLDGPSPTPLNGIDRPPAIFSNISTAYSATTVNRELT
jgi:hypothetical protein